MDLYQRAATDFNSPLDEAGLGNFFADLAKTFNCRVRYTLERTEEVGSLTTDEDSKKTKIHGLNVSGQILMNPGTKYFQSGAIMMPFEGCRTSRSPFDKVSGIRFFVPPGYEVSDMSRGELELMDDVRIWTNKCII